VMTALDPYLMTKCPDCANETFEPNEVFLFRMLLLKQGILGDHPISGDEDPENEFVPRWSLGIGHGKDYWE